MNFWYEIALCFAWFLLPMLIQYRFEQVCKPINPASTRV